MNHNTTFAIGLMSGTSLDGIDLAYVKFTQTKESFYYSIIHSETFKYSEEWIHRLKNAFSDDKKLISKLDTEYGSFLGGIINTFILKNDITKIDLIASHGHTIFHKPDEGITVQIGNGDVISKATGLKVIYDFRTQDVTLGGQGAPLVPIGDELLFSKFKYCLNLGGFANISFHNDGERIAFDICPVNIVMNHYANKLGLAYDNKGSVASRGIIHTPLLVELNALPYYSESAPKSLGFEFVIENIFPAIDKYKLSEQDILRTFIAHVVQQIKSKIYLKGKLLISGGGTYNIFLIQELQKQISNTIHIPDDTLIDFKEALIFALLGTLKNQNKVNCLKSVTGASKDHSSGKISLPIRHR
jgi:anhydro-N-acetylmuramic acid kinase